MAVETYRSVDKDGDGGLDASEMGELLKKLGIDKDLPGGKLCLCHFKGKYFFSENN